MMENNNQKPEQKNRYSKYYWRKMGQAFQGTTNENENQYGFRQWESKIDVIYVLYSTITNIRNKIWIPSIYSWILNNLLIVRIDTIMKDMEKMLNKI